MRDLADFDVLILPGWHNSGPDHWQSHWEAAFPRFRRVQQADWAAPRFEDWAQRLSEAVEACERPALLVAHSLGTALVTRWALGADTGRVAGAFLVATTDVDRFAGLPETAFRGFDPVPMRPLPFPSCVVASRNDERVTPERARAFAEAWGSRFVDAGHLGHMGSAARLGLWPQGLVWLGQFLAALETGRAA